MSTDETTVRTLLRELPKMRVALVLLLVVVNMGVSICRRGCAIGRERGSRAPAAWNGRGLLLIHEGVTPEDEELREGRVLCFVPPTRWSRSEWRETLWMWR